MRKYSFVFIAFVWGWVACTGHFKSLNTDKTGMTDEEMEIDLNHLGIPLGIIQQGIYFNYDFGKGKNWPYQIMQNLSADMFSGYMHDYKPLNGGSHNSDYNMQNGWNGTFWENTYAYVMPQIKRLEDLTRLDYPAFFAITKILKVEVMHRVSDYYGPIIYSQFGNLRESYAPDNQEEAYRMFFEDLDEAVNILDQAIKEGEDASAFAKFDIIMDGTYESWVKFANSLRLRLAIRLAVVNPEEARREFRKGMVNSYGIFTTSPEKAVVSTKNGYTNPLGVINQVWGEAYMNASMESILNGYEDPRRAHFFEVCPNDVQGENGNIISIKGEYRGIRQGTVFAHMRYSALSRIYVEESSEAILMTAAEVWFLRAEAALRGWTSEVPGDCYREGVRCSFNQWGAAGVEAYLQSDRVGADYVDVFEPVNNIKARCLVSPRWDESASREVKLEKIITQKWLAVFPEGCEAWAEQRRTGYPRLFPVRVNNSKDGCIDTELMIRRLNFPASMIDVDPEQYEKLKKALQGDDTPGTRLWWDTGKNF